MTPTVNIAAIIISYNDAAAVARAVDALVPQVRNIFIIDNGSTAEHQTILQDLAKQNDVFVQCLPENLGLAAAMNIGVQLAKERGNDWILMSDQDSVCAPDMVAQMMDLTPEYPNSVFTPQIAALGAPLQQTHPVDVPFAITSGNLLPLAAYEQIGGMDEGLFIDGIDFDMSLKLRKCGYRIVRVPRATMEHSLGDAPSQTPVLGRFHTNHSPVRRYYMMRNYVHNFRRHAQDFPKFFVKLTLVFCLSLMSILVLGPKRYTSFRMMARGLRDGVRGQSGPIPPYLV